MINIVVINFSSSLGYLWKLVTASDFAATAFGSTITFLFTLFFFWITNTIKENEKIKRLKTILSNGISQEIRENIFRAQSESVELSFQTMFFHKLKNNIKIINNILTFERIAEVYRLIDEYKYPYVSDPTRKEAFLFNKKAEIICALFDFITYMAYPNSKPTELENYRTEYAKNNDSRVQTAKAKELICKSKDKSRPSLKNLGKLFNDLIF